jgi:hypothetical protein
VTTSVPNSPASSWGARRRRSVWQYIFGVIVAAYTIAFAAVIWIGAGFGKHVVTPTPASVALAYVSPTPTVPPTLAPTPTPLAPTATPIPPTPTRPPNTATPDPNVDFRVPLAASNTGNVQGQRVAILNITDDARSGTASARPIAGFKFVTVEVLVENTGDTPTNIGRWQVHTAPAGDYNTSAVTGFGDVLATTTPVAPRSIQRGVLVFSVPTNAKLVWIQYIPNPAYRGALYFDAA